MSVNRNILKNSATPLSGDISPTEVNAETVSGSRYVILDFLNTAPTSSNGSCTAVNLEWSPDPSMITNPYQPSSSYYSVTSSVLSCQSASLNPLTGSVAWSQFINSYWQRTLESPLGYPTKYYVRAKQTRNTSPIAIYSPAIPIETRANAYCTPVYTASAAIFSNYIVADMDGWNSPGYAGKWLNDSGDSSAPSPSASFTSGAPGTSGSSFYIVKAGGPNYDAIRSDGEQNISWPGVAISSSSPVRAGVGIVKGVAEFTAVSNNLDFKVQINADAVATTGSINIIKVATGQVVGQIASASLPLNLVNRYVEVGLNSAGTNTCTIFVDGVDVGFFSLSDFGASGPITLKNNFAVTLRGKGSGYLPDTAIIRCVTAQIPYNPSAFHCKYGPIGSGSYVE